MKTKRDKLLTRWGHLRSERATWWSHWQEVTTYLLPRNGRYLYRIGTKDIEDITQYMTILVLER